ncbi:MAG: Gfo/Idh/MocA family oxidoreductase [Clostridia bacterium]|nr:Gfo/Idh/MocA family oxidoreductase [Clostridia bacterium]
MKKITAVLIGAGNRGRTYANFAHDYYGDKIEIVAVAEPDESIRSFCKEKYELDDSACYHDWDELFAKGKIADAAIIATQDKDHLIPALRAIDLGYDLLLEKPMAVTPEECIKIADRANEKGVNVVVCHVLRYTPFFGLLKRLIDEDKVGRVINIIHVEGVGERHYSHSYTRGNWCNVAKSSPMILAKSCHDMDILQWLLGKRCTKVQSFGSLTHFTHENCPEGAPARCIDGCPYADECTYNAVRLYQKDRWFIGTATGKVKPTDEDIDHMLRTSDYGRCVYQSDNDVVDHQTVNLEFEDHSLVSFTMSAFNKGGRFIRIMGTKGELTAYMSDDKIKYYNFLTKETTEISVKDAVSDETIVGGHGGGDKGIVGTFAELLLGTYNGNCLSDVSVSCENHLIAFAAEESRLHGTIVNMDEYVERCRKNAAILYKE